MLHPIAVIRSSHFLATELDDFSRLTDELRACQNIGKMVDPSSRNERRCYCSNDLRTDCQVRVGEKEIAQLTIEIEHGHCRGAGDKCRCVAGL